MKIAIIGTGIAGLGTAHYLHPHHDIEVFEANDYIGGHTNTIVVDDGGKPLAVDTGFIVHNDKTYPNLLRLFAELGVETQDSNMSFSLKCRHSGFEYGSFIPWGLLARKRNLISLDFWRMVLDYRRFGQDAHADLVDERYEQMTLGDYIAEKGYSDSFLKYLLLPMASAIWSSPQSGIYDFPARYLLKFYAHHGVLDAGDGVQWRTVTGGSHMYVKPLVAPFRDKIHLNCPIQSVRRLPDGAVLTLPDGEERFYHKVVIATHSDQALRLLADPSQAEGAILGDMPYAKNVAVLHTDERVMPQRKAAWASWNYTLHKGRTQDDPAALTYWMNFLQNLESDTNYFVTINPADDIAPDKVIKEIQYAHPQYSLASLAAQRRMPEINGKNHTYFCGAYCGHGFHEDGLESALVVVDLLKEVDTVLA